MSLVLDRLVRPGLVDLRTAVARMSADPARLLHLPGGSLAAGAPADVTLLDLEREAFLSLVAEPKTLARIQHTLKTGKPLRN